MIRAGPREFVPIKHEKKEVGFQIDNVLSLGANSFFTVLVTPNTAFPPL